MKKKKKKHLTDLELIIRQLRILAAKALEESNKAQSTFERIVRGIDSNTENPTFRSLVGQALAQRALFYVRLGQYHPEIIADLSKVQAGFGKLSEAADPLLKALDVGQDKIPSIQESVDALALQVEFEGMILRRDFSLAMIEAPLYAAIIAMNEATHILIGERRRFSIDFQELLKDLVGLSTNLVSGSEALVIIIKQFRDRIKEAARKLVAGASQAERLFEFNDVARASVEVLEEWFKAANIALDDLRRIASSDFPSYMERLRANIA